MKENGFLKKIWTDPVWSKVISAAIIVLFTYVLKQLFPSFINNYFKETIICISLFIFVLLLINFVVILNKNKPDIRWLKNMLKNHTEDYIFLLWFPINKKVRNDKSYLMLHDDESIRMVNSIIVKKLEDHNIFEMGSYGIIEINAKAYDYLEGFYNKCNKNDEFIKTAKMRSLEDLALHTAKKT
jgi:hypothetical protein